MAIFVIQSCAPQSIQFQEYLLGTVISGTIHDHGTQQLVDSIIARIQVIEKHMSLQNVDSQLNAISNAAGVSPIQVEQDVFDVIQAAIGISKASNGAFDPTIAPIVQAWDITGNPRVPSDSELVELLPLLGWSEIQLDAANRTVYLPRTGMKLDLGAIAKGYAADEAARLCREAGVQSALLDLGGNIIVVGLKPNQQKWRLGIQDPQAARGTALGLIADQDATLVTSGAYERFFEKDGVKYHHILSPQDGKPVQNSLLQVSILSQKSSMIADSLSTACFVLGKEKGLELLAQMPGYEGVFVEADKTVTLTVGLINRFELLDSSYSMAKN